MKTELDFFIQVLKKELEKGDFEMTPKTLIKLSKQSNVLYKQYHVGLTVNKYHGFTEDEVNELAKKS